MSFYSISDPVERERVVEDYKRIKREIRERNENKKMSGQNRYRSLQETFNPVVKAQEDMAEKIVNSLKEIKPVKEETIPLKEEKVLKPSKKRRLRRGKKDNLVLVLQIFESDARVRFLFLF